jgi:hypothetical protein
MSDHGLEDRWGIMTMSDLQARSMEGMNCGERKKN